jgi:hypothetical protein
MKNQLLLQHVVREARKKENWDDLTAMLNQTVFLESLDFPRTNIFTINAKNIDSAFIDRKILQKIQNSLKKVPRVLTTIVDNIEITCDGDEITCTKVLAQARKEVSLNFSLKSILRMNIISIDTILYIDINTRRYRERIFIQ